MEIIPAIDVYDGECVRLSKGRLEEKTVYSKDPLEIAGKFADAGIKLIHFVDLNGAFTGIPSNFGVLERIISETGLKVETGGGIRDLKTVRSYMTSGVERVVLGSALVSDLSMAEKAASLYGKRIYAGIDIYRGKVAVKGWKELAEAPPAELLAVLKKAGIGGVIYTDIDRDGMLSGPSMDNIKAFAAMSPLDFIVSGGIKSAANLDEIMALNLPNISGIIVGKAYYNGDISLEELSRYSGAL